MPLQPRLAEVLLPRDPGLAEATLDDGHDQQPPREILVGQRHPGGRVARVHVEQGQLAAQRLEVLGGEATAKKRGARERLLAVAIVAAGLGAFIVQNTDSTPVTWLIFTGTAPVWVVIVLAAVAGAVLSELGGYLIRRRRQRAN